MLFNEPKLLKCYRSPWCFQGRHRFSALQRAEIAEIMAGRIGLLALTMSFSALQRAEIAEIADLPTA